MPKVERKVKMNEYVNHLMKCINNSRDIAMKELPQIGSQGHDSKEEIEKWYDTIYEWISKNPPSFYVKYIEIVENYNSEITSIKYICFETEDEISEASIKVVSELYDFGQLPH